MFLEGIILMLVGMGAVFLFLFILVLVTNTSSSIIKNIEERLTADNAK